MNFGENLRMLRKQEKMSQEVLADKLGVTRQAVSRWETGEVYPEMTNIVALCSIFKCNINDLINDNIIDVKSFDKVTLDEIETFKANQQHQMRLISKSIYIIANLLKHISLIPIIIIFIISIIFPFISNNNYFYDIKNEIKVLDNLIINNSNLNISFEYFLICNLVLSILTYFILNYFNKLYRNIYFGKTPLTLENEKYVNHICLFIILEQILKKIFIIVYYFINNLKINSIIEFTDILLLLVIISISYIFKYARIVQSNYSSKII